MVKQSQQMQCTSSGSPATVFVGLHDLERMAAFVVAARFDEILQRISLKHITLMAQTQYIAEQTERERIATVFHDCFFQFFAVAFYTQ